MAGSSCSGTGAGSGSCRAAGWRPARARKDASAARSVRSWVSPSRSDLLDAWVYEPLRERRAFVVTYGCFVEDANGMSRSAEHTALGSFEVDALEEIDLPAGYVRAVWVWAGMESVRAVPGPDGP